jgi:pilus assembly protein Flp/PilA
MTFNKLLRKFARNEDGATAVEYVLIIAGIAVVIIGAVGIFGDTLVTEIEGVLTTLGIGGGE